MWLLYAVGSAFFAGVTSILAKCGIRKTDSTVATAVRTIVILIFSWVIVGIVGSADEISLIDARTLVFLILSGAATGASWLCYFKALQTGDINKVVPIDKSSTVLTILLALIFLQEGISIPKAAAVIVIAAGIFLMIEKKDVEIKDSRGRIRSICKSYGDPRKGRDLRRGIQSRHSNPYLCGACDGLAYGGNPEKAAGSPADSENRADLYLLLRDRYRSFMALLLPGSSGRPGQYCGSC